MYSPTKTIAEKICEFIENEGLGVMDANGIEEGPNDYHFCIETEQGFYNVEVSPAFSGQLL